MSAAPAPPAAAAPSSSGGGPGAWLLRVEAAFSALTPASLDVEQFLAAAALVKEGYAVLYSEGMISRTLSSDLQGNLSKVAETARATAPPSTTLAQYFEREFAAGGGTVAGAKARDGLFAGLWLCRTLRFVARLLALLGDGRALEITAAGRTTYDEILHQYHGPLLGVIVGMAFSWAPSRASLIAALREKDGVAGEPQASALLARAAAAMEKPVAALYALYTERDCDWPDRVGI